MKKILLLASVIMVAVSVLTAVSCGGSKGDTSVVLPDGEFRIEGQLQGNQLDSALLFLVPMEGPHPRPVDSVYVGRDGKFVFTGNVEQMAVLRLSWHQRYGTQDLLVVTEPGVIHVTLDSVSSAYGTPQNDALQQWKEWREDYTRQTRELYLLSTRVGRESEEYKSAYQALRQAGSDFNYDFFHRQGRQTLTVFLYKMAAGSIDSLRRSEFDELLRDTVDYTKPQPGFRR